jgi:hypothetical protein
MAKVIIILGELTAEVIARIDKLMTRGCDSECDRGLDIKNNCISGNDFDNLIDLPLEYDIHHEIPVVLIGEMTNTLTAESIHNAIYPSGTDEIVTSCEFLDTSYPTIIYENVIGNYEFNYEVDEKKEVKKGWYNSRKIPIQARYMHRHVRVTIRNQLPYRIRPQVLKESTVNLKNKR